MIQRMLIMLLCTGLLFGGIFGYKAFTSHQFEKAMSTVQAPPVTVSTTTAATQAWQPQLELVGTVRAMRGVDVTTEVAGLVRAVSFNSGDRVRGGQVLVRLNTDADKALLHSLEAEAELARITFERDKEQFAVKATSKAAVDASEADLKSKQAQVAQQIALLAKKTIRAPFSGRVGITTVNPGQFLNPGDRIVTLQSFDSVYVDFLLPQQHVGSVAVGQTVSATTNAHPGRSFEGQITAISSKVDTQTRNIEIEATFENPQHELVPGMFTLVRVQAGEAQNYITLPQTAVIYNPYGETVFVVEHVATEPKGSPELVAKQAFVTVGEKRGDQAAILDGVKEGDTIVTSGQLKLRSGSRVTINNEIQPSGEAAPQPVDE